MLRCILILLFLSYSYSCLALDITTTGELGNATALDSIIVLDESDPAATEPHRILFTADEEEFLNGLGQWITLSDEFEPLKTADDNYVTDAEKVVLGNTSGTNTGDQDMASPGDIGTTTPGEGYFTYVNTDSLDINPPPSGSTGELSMYEDPDSTGGNVVGWKAPTDVDLGGAQEGDLLWMLPGDDGTSGQAMVTDGLQTLSWRSFEVADSAITKTDEAETITADWVNTANPWGLDDVVDGYIRNTGDVGTGVYDFGGADFEVPNSATLPATCTVGDVYVDTDADTDGSLYICTVTDTWKEVDDDGGAGGMSNIVEDTSPQLGGDLDIQAHSIEGVDATEFGYLDGVTEDVQTALNTIPSDAYQFSFTDLTDTYEGNYIRIDKSTDFSDAYILCDAAETTTPVEFDLYVKATIGGTASVLTASQLTMSTTASYVDEIDISSLTTVAAGSWIRLDITTAADTATECTVSLNL